MDFEITEEEAEEDLEEILRPSMVLQMLSILKGRLKNINTDQDKIELLYENEEAKKRTPENVREGIIRPYVEGKITRDEAAKRSSKALKKYREAHMKKGYKEPSVIFEPQ